MVTGRELDVENIAENIERETNYIMVDRNNILQTAFDEITSLTNLRKTLEVDFYGEVAQDCGGPIKEFFALALREIKTKDFDHGLREMLREDYKAIGIIFGLSILQNEKIPTFLGEALLEKVFTEENTEPCIQELCQGFGKVGISQIARKLPMFLHLMRPSHPQPLTVKKITNLLMPSFSEEGSNKRLQENAVYSKFLMYIREVASGRRSRVTLSDILRFATGAEEEPVLGFSLKPKLEFVEVSASFIPTSSTCSNSLKLPRLSQDIKLPPQEKLFGFYDMAFSNTFFGLV